MTLMDNCFVIQYCRCLYVTDNMDFMDYLDLEAIPCDKPQIDLSLTVRSDRRLLPGC